VSAPSFHHQIAAHCETGTVRGILHHHGLSLSEPMVFGIGSGIFFAYFRWPSFTFHKVVCRSRPGTILRNVVKRLGIKGKFRRFRNPAKAAGVLDGLLAGGKPASLQVDMFHMDYMPEFMRIHFNAHYINVFGRENDHYLVSDAYVPEISKLSRHSLELARFVKGDLAPKGFMFYPERVPSAPQLERAVIRGIKSACFMMTRIPVGPLGVRGIRRFSETIVRWPEIAESEDRLAHEIIMFGVMMEDMGTGGAGFRFLYASFLQEAAELLGSEEISRLAERMRENGDRWREISLLAARTGKERDFSSGRLGELSRLIAERAEAEKEIFQALSKAV
jgi:hypothetical protein